MTHQFDMMPAALTDPAVLERIDAQLPKVRDVKAPRLPDVLPVVDATGEETVSRESSRKWGAMTLTEQLAQAQSFVAKERAIARVISESAAESSAVLASNPNALGLVMHYRIRMVAIQQIAAIMAHSPGDRTGTTVEVQVAKPEGGPQ
jgi:hypothetical protein